MNYFNLKFRVDFLGHVKNVIINILFFTVYLFYKNDYVHQSSLITRSINKRL